MSETRKLSEQELEAALADLPEWVLKEGKLHRTYRFKNFVKAMGFMMSAALVAEKQGHHPEWSNVWNRVTVNLVTHDAGNAVSTADTALAREFDRLFDG